MFLGFPEKRAKKFISFELMTDNDRLENHNLTLNHTCNMEFLPFSLSREDGVKNLCLPKFKCDGWYIVDYIEVLFFNVVLMLNVFVLQKFLCKMS